LSIQQEEKRARKLADAVDKEEALGSVAVRFQGFQREFPRSRYADKALFSAVLIYDQADELDHALAAAERMERRYGEKASKVARKKKRRTKKARSRRSKLRRNLAQGSGRTERQELLRRNHLLRATFYERIADFRTAARLYESYYRKYPDHSKASTALFNAGVYYEGLGDIDRAVAKFEAYIELFSSKDEARVYWRVCELEASRDKWKAAAECFEAFRQRYRTAPQAEIFESRYRYALALEKLKRPADAKKEFEWLVRAYPKLKRRARDSDEARLAGAHAAFKLLDPDYRRYAALKVTLRKKSLLAKVKGAEDLACAGEACKRAGRFLRVLEYGNGRFGICALTRIGEVYRDLADAIRAAPIPRKLSFDQQEIYRAELDTVALGPEEKGIEAFENALRKAYELNVYNRCLLKAQESLAEINPDQFPTLQRRRLRTAEGVALVGVREEVRVGHPADEILSER
ncbi:MAG: tetratricopeptide repeat protein, partial [Myxococcota bacterium]